MDHKILLEKIQQLSVNITRHCGIAQNHLQNGNYRKATTTKDENNLLVMYF
jgi:hypothetical protein